MDISTYLKTYGYKAGADLAEKAGTNLMYLKQIMWGLRTMSAELAIRLESASNGLVTTYENRPDLPWPHAPRASCSASPPLPIDAATA